MADRERDVSIRVSAQTRALNKLNAELAVLRKTLRGIDGDKHTFEVEAVYDDLDEIEKIMSRIRGRGEGQKLSMELSVANARDWQEILRIYERLKSAEAEVEVKAKTEQAKERVDALEKELIVIDRMKVEAEATVDVDVEDGEKALKNTLNYLNAFERKVFIARAKIDPDTEGGEHLIAALDAALDTARRFRREVQASQGDIKGMGSAASDSQREMEKSRRSVEGIAREFRTLRNVRAEVDVDTDDAERNLKKLVSNLDSLEQKTVRAKASVEIEGDAGEEIRRDLDAFLKGVRDLRAEVKVDLDTATARRKAEDLRGEVEALGRLRATAIADLDARRGTQAAEQFLDNLKQVDRRVVTAHIRGEIDDSAFTRLRAELASIDDAEVKVRVETAQAFEGMGLIHAMASRLDGMTIKMGVNMNLSGHIAQMLLLRKAALDASAAFETKLSKSMRTFHNLMQLLVRMAVVFIFSALTPLTAGVLALAGVLVLAAAGFGILAAAIAPTIQNFSDYDTALQKQRSTQETLRNAQESHADATEAYAQAQKDAAADVADAQEDVADAAKAVGEAQREGTQQVKAAIEDHADAVRDLGRVEVQTAQQVADARESYRDSVQDYKDAQQEAAQGVRDAYADVRDQERELAETRRSVQQDINDSYESWQDAVANIRDVEQQVAQDIRDADRDVAESKRNLAETIRDVNESIREADRRVAESQQDLRDQYVENAEAIAEANERIRESQENLAETREDVADDIREQYQSWQDSLEDIADAEEDAREQIVEAIERHREALANLRETEREAAQYIRDAYRDAREAARGAQEAELAVLDAREDLRDATEDLVDAQEALNRAMRDEPSTLREMELDLEAQRLEATDLAFRRAEAEEALRNAMAVGDLEAVARLQHEIATIQNRQEQGALAAARAEEDLQAARVNGSDALQGAWDDLESAYDSQQSAQQDLIDSQRDLVEAQREAAQTQRVASRAQIVAAKMIAEAMQEVIDTAHGVNEAEQEGAESVAEARKRAREEYRAYRDAIEDGAESIRDAEEQVADAIEDRNDQLVENAERIRELERAVGEAIRDRNQAIREGAHQIAEAERGVKDAIAARNEVVREGQERINEAYEEARDQYQAYRETAVNGARQIREAENSLKEAQDAVNDAREEGRELVISAYQSMQEQAEAYRRAEQARAWAIQDAMQRVNETESAIHEARVQRANAVAAAEDGLKDAVEALRDTQIDAHSRTQDAFETMKESAKDLRHAMQQAKKATREFNNSALEPFEKRLKRVATQWWKEWGDNMLPVRRRLSNIAVEVLNFSKRYFPLMQETGMAAAEGLGAGWDHFRNLLKRPVTNTAIEQIMSEVGPFVKTISTAAADLLVGLLHMFAAVVKAPEFKDFVNWIGDISERFREWTEGDMRGSLRRIFEDAAPFFEQAQKTLGAIWDFLTDLASDPDIQRFASDFLKLIQYIAENGHFIKLPMEVMSRTLHVFLADNVAMGNLRKLVFFFGGIYLVWKAMAGPAILAGLKTFIKGIAFLVRPSTAGGLTKTAAAMGKLRTAALVLSRLAPIAIIATVLLTFNWEKADAAYKKARKEGRGVGGAFAKAVEAGIKDVPVLGRLAKDQWADKAFPIDDIVGIWKENIDKAWEGEITWTKAAENTREGMLDAFQTAFEVNPLVKLFKWIFGGLLKWLGIKSPSTRARDEIGKPIIRGIIEGLKDVPILGSIIKLFERVWKGAKKFWNSDDKKGLLKDWAWKIVARFWNWARDKIPLVGWFDNIFKRAKRFRDKGDKEGLLRGWGSALAKAFWEWAKDKLPFLGWFEDIFQRAKEYREKGNKEGLLRGWGLALAKAFWDWARDKIPFLGWFQNIWEKAKRYREQGNKNGLLRGWGLALAKAFWSWARDHIPFRGWFEEIWKKAKAYREAGNKNGLLRGWGGALAKAFWDWARDHLPFRGWFEDIWQKAKAYREQGNKNGLLRGWGLALAKAFWDWAKDKIPFRGWFENIWERAKAYREAGNKNGLLRGWGLALLKAFWDWAKDKVPLYGWFDDMWRRTVQFREQGNKDGLLRGWAQALVKAFWEWAGQKENWALPEWIQWIMDAVKTFLSSWGTGSWLINLGMSIFSGLIQGVSKNGQNFVETIQKYLDRAIKAIWDRIKPGSPSRVGRFFGANLMDGLEAGVGEKGENVVRAVADTMSRVIDATRVEAASQEIVAVDSLIQREEKRLDLIRQQVAAHEEAGRSLRRLQAIQQRDHRTASAGWAPDHRPGGSRPVNVGADRGPGGGPGSDPRRGHRASVRDTLDINLNADPEILRELRDRSGQRVSAEDIIEMIAEHLDERNRR